MRIRDHDWSATPLGPIEQWPSGLRTAVDLMLASAQPAYIAWGPELISLYNDGYIPIAGDKHPQALGQPYRVMWAEVWNEFRPAVEAVMAGQARYSVDQPAALAGRPDRPMSWFTYSWTPLRDDSGVVVGFYCVATETTERVLAERSRERNYRALFEAIDQGFCVIEVIFDTNGAPVDYVFLETNPAFDGQTGLVDAVGKRVRTLVPGHEQFWFDTYGRIALTGRPERFEHRADALGRWYDVYAFRIGDPADRQVAVLFNDIAERKHAEAALRASEARFRALVTAGSHLVYRMSPDWQVMRELDGRGLLVDMTQPSECWLDAYIPPDDRPAVLAAIGAAIRDRSMFELEHRVRLADGSIGWTYSRAVPILGDDGEILEWFGTATDVTDRKRAEEALRASESRLAALFESVPAGLGATDAAGRTIVANAEYRRFLPTGVIPSRDPQHGHCWKAWDERGRPLAPKDYPTARALRGESVVPGQEMLFTDDSGREVWTNVASTPTRDRAGQVNGCVSVISDIDERKRIADALKESEAHYRSLFEAIDEGYCVMRLVRDGDGRIADMIFIEVNPAFARHTGLADVVGRAVSELLPNVEAHWIDLVTRVAETGTPERAEDYVRDIDRWYRVHHVSISSRDDDLVAVVFEDITERKRHELALRASEERLRQFGEASQDILWIRDADTLQWTYLTPAFERIYGLRRDQAQAGDNYRNWLATIMPGDRAGVVEAIRRVRSGEHVSFEYRVRRPSDGEVRWLRDTGFPIRDHAGRIVLVAGIGQDITADRESEGRQRILLAELQHRVRNILAVIRSIVSRSDDGERTTEDYVQHLQGRVSALARTQVMLTRAAGAGVDVQDMIRDELVAQAAQEAQFALEGPDVDLSPKAAEVLTLAIHELATNATKYGAFARGGRVRVDWRVETRDRQDWLVLRWREQGVPIVEAAPRRRGFGTELISRRIPYELKGRGSLELKPGGLECHIEFPLRPGDSILESGGSHA